jgi:hypothetical protein
MLRSFQLNLRNLSLSSIYDQCLMKFVESCNKVGAHEYLVIRDENRLQMHNLVAAWLPPKGQVH